jgi:hypothetical protein
MLLAAGWARALALDGQALAALGAACVEHGTATTGFHTHQKTVGTGAADFGGLVGAFHVGPVDARRKACGVRGGSGRRSDAKLGTQVKERENCRSKRLACSCLPARLFCVLALLACFACLPAWGRPATVRPRHAAFGMSRSTCRVQHVASGKPTITAKNAFAVKHLHHRPPHLTGLDGAAEVVDNCAPPEATALNLAAPTRRFPQNEPRPMAARL